MAILIVLSSLIHWINLSIYQKLGKCMYFTNITIFKTFYGLSKLGFRRLFAKNSYFACIGTNLDQVIPILLKLLPKSNRSQNWIFYFDCFRQRKNLLISKTLKVCKTFQFSRKYRHLLEQFKLNWFINRPKCEWILEIQNELSTGAFQAFCWLITPGGYWSASAVQ